MYSITNHLKLKKKAGLPTPATLACLFSLIIFACSSGQVQSKETSENQQHNLETNVAYSKSTLGLYDISTFDVYVDEQVIHVIASGKYSENDQHIAIRYTRSEDGGHRWQDSVAIDNSLPVTISSRGDDIQLAAKGENLVALWQTQGEFPGTGPMVSAYSSDYGKTWRRGPNPAIDNDGSQSHIDLIADKQGYFHAVWLEDPDENGYQGLRYAQSVNKGKQWSKPTTLDESTCSCCWNTMALSPDNKLNILYRDMTPRDMSLIQSSDAGLTWLHASTVGNFQWQFEGCPHVGGGLKAAGINDIAQLHSIVWTGEQGKSGLYHLSSNDHGQTWSAPNKLGDIAINGDIAVRKYNKRNKVAAIWNEMEAEGLSVFYTKLAGDGSAWLAPKRLTQASNSATHPKLVATKFGFLAIWTEKPSKQPSQLAWQIIK